VVGIIDSDSSQVIGYGSAGSSDGAAPDGTTIFEIGSITKTFTALLLAQMACSGRLALSTPADSLLPAGVILPGRRGRRIEMRHLATHTSGLPRLPGNLGKQDPFDQTNPYAGYDRTLLYRCVSGSKLRSVPGKAYEYSNLGFGLLGTLLELAAQRNYESQVVDSICDRLGMPNTGIKLNPTQERRFVAGHDGKGREVAHWDFSALAGCGALRSTADDMLRYLAAMIGGAPAGMQPAIDSCLALRYGKGRTRLGLGWHIIEGKGGRLYWHNGGTGGYSSFAGFSRDNRTAVVVLANSAASVDMTAMLIYLSINAR
jgi:CubicO group peptidase (beta-lactamase class C family)